MPILLIPMTSRYQAIAPALPFDYWVVRQIQLGGLQRQTGVTGRSGGAIDYPFAQRYSYLLLAYSQLPRRIVG